MPLFSSRKATKAADDAGSGDGASASTPKSLAPTPKPDRSLQFAQVSSAANGGLRRTSTASGKSKRNLLASSGFASDADDVELHRAARSQHPLYPPRFPVPDEKVDWDVDFPDYAPVEHVDAGVLANNVEVNPKGWAEGAVPNRQQIEQRGSHELQARQMAWQYDAKGRPCNPRGRTGMCNRGKLGKWGPNHAGDAVRHTTGPVAMRPNRVLSFARPPARARVAFFRRSQFLLCVHRPEKSSRAFPVSRTRW